MPCLPRNRFLRRRRRRAPEANLLQRFCRFAAGLCGYIACCLCCNDNAVIPITSSDRMFDDSDDDCYPVDDEVLKKNKIKRRAREKRWIREDEDGSQCSLVKLKDSKQCLDKENNGDRNHTNQHAAHIPTRSGTKILGRAQDNDDHSHVHPQATQEIASVRDFSEVQEDRDETNRGINRLRLKGTSFEWNKETQKFVLKQDVHISDIDSNSDDEDLEEWERMNVIDYDSVSEDENTEAFETSQHNKLPQSQKSLAFPPPKEKSGKTGFSTKEREEIDQILLGDAKKKSSKNGKTGRMAFVKNEDDKEETKKRKKIANKEEKLLLQKSEKRNSLKADSKIKSGSIIGSCKVAWQDNGVLQAKTVEDKDKKAAKNMNKMENADISQEKERKEANDDNSYADAQECLLLPGAISHDVDCEKRQNFGERHAKIGNRISEVKENNHTEKHNAFKPEDESDSWTNDITTPSVLNQRAEARRIVEKHTKPNKDIVEHLTYYKKKLLGVKKRNTVGVISDKVENSKDGLRINQNETDQSTFMPAWSIASSVRDTAATEAASVQATSAEKDEFCCDYHAYLAEYHGRIISRLPSWLQKTAIGLEQRRRELQRCNNRNRNDDCNDEENDDAVNGRNVARWAERVSDRQRRKQPNSDDLQ